MEFWLALAIVVSIVIVVAIIRAQQLENARLAYQDALMRLSDEPSDNQLRIAALEAGRHYADLARRAAGNKRRAIFDEVALSNDLNARSGAPAARPADTRKCPQCAELIKAEARICRFCQYKLEMAA